MVVKDLIIEYIEQSYNNLEKHMEELKAYSKKKTKNAGALYFMKRADVIINKMENLTVLNEVVKNMEFKYNPNIRNEPVLSEQGIYCNRKEIFYTDKLLEMEDDQIIKYVINEILYAMLKTTATASQAYLDKLKNEVNTMYPIMGLIRIADPSRTSVMRRKMEELSNEVQSVSPNAEAVKLRHIENKTLEYEEYFKIVSNYEYHSIVVERKYNKKLNTLFNVSKYLNIVKQDKGKGNMFVERNKLRSYIE